MQFDEAAKLGVTTIRMDQRAQQSKQTKTPKWHHRIERETV
jgi:hypothetical protein